MYAKQVILPLLPPPHMCGTVFPFYPIIILCSNVGTVVNRPDSTVSSGSQPNKRWPAIQNLGIVAATNMNERNTEATS